MAVEARPELDAIDAAICLVLQSRPYATARELTPVVAEATDGEIADALDRLRADGLVQVIDDTPPRYAAKVAPDTAAEMLTRRTKVHRQRATAAARCRTPLQRSAINGVPQVLTGREESRRVIEGLQRSARREVLGVDRPPYLGDLGPNLVEREQLANGVDYRVVYDRAALGLPGRLETITEMIELGEQARTAPAVPMKMMIVDRAVAVIPLQVSERTVERSLVVGESALLSALTRVFADLWHNAVSFGAGAAPLDGAPTSEERRILALLASGATDESIGRLMGFSPRTAHRRVRDLAAKLGVATRFQAGVQAVRQGWL